MGEGVFCSEVSGECSRLDSSLVGGERVVSVDVGSLAWLSCSCSIQTDAHTGRRGKKTSGTASELSL